MQKMDGDPSWTTREARFSGTRGPLIVGSGGVSVIIGTDPAYYWVLPWKVPVAWIHDFPRQLHLVTFQDQWKFAIDTKNGSSLWSFILLCCPDQRHGISIVRRVLCFSRINTTHKENKPPTFGSVKRLSKSPFVQINVRNFSIEFSQPRFAFSSPPMNTEILVLTRKNIYISPFSGEPDKAKSSIYQVTDDSFN